MDRLARALLLTVVMFVSAPTLSVTAQSSLATPVAATPIASATAAPVTVRVMTFNVWLGGVQVDFGQIVSAIETAQADVVGLQEAEGHTRAIADALGWPYADERLHVISRYPLLDPPGANGLYTFVAVRPGQVFAIANVHLPSGPYGPDAVRDGMAPEELFALETATRLAPLEVHLARLPELVAKGIPVVLTGDFNTPSHLDAQCCATRITGPVDSPIAWPVGEALADAGFVDTFRAVHPANFAMK